MNEPMNQDILRLKQMLEEVTAADTSLAGQGPSASDPTSAVDLASQGGDAETTALRDAWLAFGQLIRAADASLPAMPNLTASIAPQKSHRKQMFGIIAAVAAVLIVAVTFAWWTGRDSQQGSGQPSLAQTLTPRQAEPQPVRSTGVSPANRANQTATNQTVTNQKPTVGATKPAAASRLNWDDPLETQIAAVSQQIRSVQQNWQHRVDGVDLVHYRIDEVTDSLQNDAL